MGAICTALSHYFTLALLAVGLVWAGHQGWLPTPKHEPIRVHASHGAPVPAYAGIEMLKAAALEEMNRLGVTRCTVDLVFKLAPADEGNVRVDLSWTLRDLAGRLIGIADQANVVPRAWLNERNDTWTVAGVVAAQGIKRMLDTALPPEPEVASRGSAI